MDCLIKMDGEVANNLINKLASAIGWVANRETPEKIAIDGYIKDIQLSNYDPLTKAALISSAKRTIKEYINQHNICTIATQSLLPSAKADTVDEDWLAQFMDKARLVSSSDFQILWGNILAEECNVPGSVPKSLLHIMEQMDRSMAEGFMKLAAISVQWEEDGICSCSPIYFPQENEEYYKENGITFELLVELQSIGLIETSLGIMAASYRVNFYDSKVPLKYFSQEYFLPEGESSINLGNVIYTKAGTALCLAVQSKELPGFLTERCIPVWEKWYSEKKANDNENRS